MAPTYIYALLQATSGVLKLAVYPPLSGLFGHVSLPIFGSPNMSLFAPNMSVTYLLHIGHCVVPLTCLKDCMPHKLTVATREMITLVTKSQFWWVVALLHLSPGVPLQYCTITALTHKHHLVALY